ncbi:MFS transporter [Microbacterium sp. NPDC096154]|uniref:MFS transporter n=1 Tax=Microbacterium sp. NPDC096154 TaxID=3155549 RepID=UPI0033229E99
MTDAAAAPAAAPPENGFRTFVHVLINTGLANITTNYLWWALTFWIYVETENVLATGVIGGAFMLFIALFSMPFGTLVDRFRKKPVMVWATLAALAVFCLDAAFYFAIPEAEMLDIERTPWFWIFAVVMLAGAVVEQLRNIALSTSVTLLVPEPKHANANGLVGTVQGLSFLVTSVLSGLSVGLLGMGPTLIIGIVAMALALLHLTLLSIPEPQVAHVEGRTGWNDVVVGWRAVRAAKGLFGLVLFTTLNNLVGGVFMALMDPYGLTLFSTEMWGIWLAVASTGFIVGGSIVAKFGLGANPVRTLLIVGAIIGLIGALFGIREWSWLFVGGMWLYMAAMPVVEAAEQTVIQRVVPYEKQGRVFGFAMMFEAAAAPITSFLIAPLAEYWIIPYMDSSEGRAEWAWLLGEGEARGIALVFLVGGLLATLLCVIAMLSPVYRTISRQYAESAPPQPEPGQTPDDARPLPPAPGPETDESVPNDRFGLS